MTFALRSASAGQGGSGRLRALLVVLQFAVSIGLGITAMVVFSQTSYARRLDLGFRHDNILIVDRLFGAAELRLGSGERQQTVRIVRTDGRPAS